MTDRSHPTKPPSPHKHRKGNEHAFIRISKKLLFYIAIVAIAALSCFLVLKCTGGDTSEQVSAPVESSADTIYTDKPTVNRQRDTNINETNHAESKSEESPAMDDVCVESTPATDPLETDGMYDFDEWISRKRSYDPALLVGMWVSADATSECWHYESNGNGLTWDTDDDVLEKEAQAFIWTLEVDQLTLLHRLESSETVVPKVYTITELSSTTLEYEDNYDQTFTFHKGK